MSAARRASLSPPCVAPRTSRHWPPVRPDQSATSPATYASRSWSAAAWRHGSPPKSSAWPPLARMRPRTIRIVVDFHSRTPQPRVGYSPPRRHLAQVRVPGRARLGGRGGLADRLHEADAHALARGGRQAELALEPPDGRLEPERVVGERVDADLAGGSLDDERPGHDLHRARVLVVHPEQAPDRGRVDLGREGGHLRAPVGAPGGAGLRPPLGARRRDARGPRVHGLGGPRLGLGAVAEQRLGVLGERAAPTHGSRSHHA